VTVNDEQLKKELELKKLAYISQIEVCQSNIAKIDSVITALSTGGQIEQPQLGQSTLKDVVESAINAAPVQFTIGDVCRVIALRNPGKPISNERIAPTFWKLMKEKNFILVREGTGNQPAVYQKPNPQNTPAVILQ
jgi:hypothetical protein